MLLWLQVRLTVSMCVCIWKWFPPWKNPPDTLKQFCICDPPTFASDYLLFMMMHVFVMLVLLSVTILYLHCKSVCVQRIKAAVIMSGTPCMKILLLIRLSLFNLMALCYCKQGTDQQRGYGCKTSWLIEFSFLEPDLETGIETHGRGATGLVCTMQLRVIWSLQ